MLQKTFVNITKVLLFLAMVDTGRAQDSHMEQTNYTVEICTYKLLHVLRDCSVYTFMVPSNIFLKPHNLRLQCGLNLNKGIDWKERCSFEAGSNMPLEELLTTTAADKANSASPVPPTTLSYKMT